MSVCFINSEFKINSFYFLFLLKTDDSSDLTKQDQNSLRKKVIAKGSEGQAQKQFNETKDCVS